MDLPPSPTKSPFYDMQGEGRLLLSRSSTGTLLLDLRLEAGRGASIITPSTGTLFLDLRSEAGRVASIITSSTGTLLTRPPFRSRARGVYHYPLHRVYFAPFLEQDEHKYV